MMITLARIAQQNAFTLKEIRLRSLLDSPTAFGSTFAEESQLPDAEWINRAAGCEDETCIGLLAMDGQTACGIIRATPDDQDSTIAWVESMWVASSHRRSGVGQRLINEIVDWARLRGLNCLKLSVTSHNEPAIRLYRSCGFSMTGKTEPYPNDIRLIECEMSLALS